MTVSEVNYSDEILKCIQEILADGTGSSQREGPKFHFRSIKIMVKLSTDI